MRELFEDPAAWGAIAGAYNDAARRMLTPFSEEAVRWAGLGPEDRVLDVASGPGTTTMLAAPKVQSVRAVDFAPEMIAQLEKNTAAVDNVTASVGDGQALALADASFTAAFSMFGLMFFPDPIAGLREIHRVLEPGGRVCISSWVPATESPMMKPLLDAWMHAAPPDSDQPPPEPFAFADAQSLTTGLREGGFVDVEVREHAPTLPVASPDAYWADHRDSIIVNHARAQLGDEWPDVEQRILEHLRDSLAGVESLAMPALIGRGRR